MKRTLLAMSLAAGAQSALAEDTRQVFIVWGVGNNTCMQYLSASKQGGAAAAAYEQWLDGYITARNQTNPNILDYAGSITHTGLFAWVAKYCSTRSSARYYEAADELLAELAKTGKVRYLR